MLRIPLCTVLLAVLFRAIVLVAVLPVLLLALVVLETPLGGELVLLLRPLSLVQLGLETLLSRRNIVFCDPLGLWMIHLVFAADMMVVVDMLIAELVDLFDMVMLGVDIVDFEVVHIEVTEVGKAKIAQTGPAAATPKVNPVNIQTLSASVVPSLADTLQIVAVFLFPTASLSYTPPSPYPQSP